MFCIASVSLLTAVGMAYSNSMHLSIAAPYTMSLGFHFQGPLSHSPQAHLGKLATELTGMAASRMLPV